MHSLKELWLDNNSLQSIPGVRQLSCFAAKSEHGSRNDTLQQTLTCSSALLQSIGKLRQLRYLDLAKNRIETLDSDVSGCEALEDLLLSSNMLQHLPDSIGT